LIDFPKIINWGIPVKVIEDWFPKKWSENKKVVFSKINLFGGKLTGEIQ
jgi:hypothetical protein